jgi:AraC-like DNA-binding protein
MALITGFLRTLILLGALQGFIVSGLLWFSARSSRQTNRILAVLIFLMAMASFNMYMQDAGWLDHSLFLTLFSAIFPWIIAMPMGPLIYFYIRSLSDPDFRMSKKQSIHFYSVIIDLIPRITALVYITGLVFGWFRKNDAPWGNFIDQVNVYSDIPRWLSISIYLWISYRYLRSLKNKVATDKTAPSYFHWMEQFIKLFTIFQIIWLAYLIPYEIPRYTDQLLDNLGWYPVYIPLSILIYWLGIRGWLASVSATKLVQIKTGIGPGLSPQFSHEITCQLKNAMENDKLYLNPGLNLSVLARHTGIPAKSISAVLNQHLHKSFSEFINEYRINAIKKRLLSSSDKNLTIAGLAYECGFNSQPTFQRAFKSMQGESPSEFLIRKNLDTVE